MENFPLNFYAIAPSSPTAPSRLNHFQFPRFRFSRRCESSLGLKQSFFPFYNHLLETSHSLLCQGNLNVPGVNVSFKHGALGLVSDKAIPIRLHFGKLSYRAQTFGEFSRAVERRTVRQTQELSELIMVLAPDAPY